MVSAIIKLISKFFLLTPLFVIPLLIITFLSTLFIFIKLLLILSKRSNNKDNVVLDHILPLVICICPTIIISLLSPAHVSWFNKFQYIILLHLFIIIPLMYFWSYYRKWICNQNKKNYIYFNEPAIYLSLSISFIYPAIWGLYFSLNRYQRLGQSTDFQGYLDKLDIDIFIVILFFIPWMIWLFLVFNKYRLWFWYNYTSVVFVLHLFCLRYVFYFKFCEQLRKLSYIINKYFSLSADIYPSEYSYNTFRYLLKYFYMRPWIINLMIFFFIFGELFITKGKLYYSFYIMFWYPILYGIFYILVIFYTIDFIQDVCNVDYFNKNWEHPRYPRIFWLSFYDDESRYGFNWDLTVKEQQQVIFFSHNYLNKKFPPLFRLPRRVQYHPYCFRLKAAYKTSCGVRWVHTSIERPLHNLTGYFTRTILERIALVQHTWTPHYSLLEMIQKKFPTFNLISPWYLNFDNPASDNIRHVFEHNFKTNFLPLIKRGVIVSQYDSNVIIQTMPKNQTEPDVIINMSTSDFVAKRIHGIDQKSNTSSATSSHAYSQMTPEIYIKRMRRFISILNYNYPELTTIVAKSLDQLCYSCNDFQIHQLVWASNLHLFLNNFIPPIRIPHNFSLQNCRPEFVMLLNKAQKKIETISDYLYLRKIPEIKTFSDLLPEAALDLSIIVNYKKCLMTTKILFILKIHEIIYL